MVPYIYIYMNVTAFVFISKWLRQRVQLLACVWSLKFLDKSFQIWSFDHCWA